MNVARVRPDTQLIFEVAVRHSLKPSFIALFIGFTAYMAAPAHAQNASTSSALEQSLSLSGSLRVRYEYLDGQVRAGLNPTDAQLAFRTTLFAEYRTGGLRLVGEVYDSRAYLGKQGSSISSNEVNTFEPVQAYVAANFDAPFGKGTRASVQLGRYVLNLGSRRLIASDDFRNTTNGYSGVRADLTLRDGATATLIYTLPQIRLPDDLPSVLDNKAQLDKESFDQRLWGGIFTCACTIGDAKLETSYFRFQERDAPGRPTRDRNLHSLGARLIKEPRLGSFDYEIEGIYQLGKASASTSLLAARLPVDANFMHADLGYSFPGATKLRLSAEYDYASGDRGNGKYTRFDTLFGMRRADFGPGGIYSAIGRTNISTAGMRAEIAPSKRLDAFATYHALWLANRTDAFSTTGVRDVTGHSGRFGGHQIDGRLRYWVVPNVLRGEINAAWLSKGQFLKTAPNAPQTGSTHYLATGLTATF